MRTCTIIARNYLPFARVLASSFTAHHPGERLVALLIDDVHREVDQASEPFDVLHLADLVPDERELHRLALIYDVTELATAVKPTLLRHLLASGEPVLYLDPDICVYAPLDDIEALAAEHAIVLTPHTTEPMARDGRQPTEADIQASGIYNLGFLALGPGSERFLDWWSLRLRRDCVIDHQRMLFTDQRWMDFVPGLFRHHVITDPTVNVAYWNVDRRPMTRSGQRFQIDGRPLRFFHFSGFSPERPHLLSRHQGERPRVLLSERPDVAELCTDYTRRLRAAGLASGDARPSYAWGRLPNGLELDTTMRRTFREALIAAESGAAAEPPDAFDPRTVEAFVAWLDEPVRPGVPVSVSRYLLARWDERPDLRAAFPDPLARDSERFLEWIRAEGARQMRVPRRFRPRPGVGVAAPAGPFDPPRQPGVNVAGYLRAELGVGEGGRLLVSILESAGVPHSTFVYGDTSSRQSHPFVERGERSAPYDVNVLCINADRVRHFANEVGPSFFADRYTIGMWAWELEDFPPSMHDGFHLVDEIWAVSTFAAAAIARVSPKPVFALPHPVLVPRIPDDLHRADFGLPEARPLFLFMFDLLSIIERKNPFAVIEAFTRAFAPGEGPLLVIKTMNGDLRLRDLEQLRAAAAVHPDVVLMDRYLSAAERTALMAMADCYVSLHRAEGFGLTMAEAMALGKPVIATRYSGNLDFMTDANSFLVDATLVPIPEGCDPYPAGSRWADPDIDAAAALMRAVVDDPSAAAARGGLAALDMLGLHSPEARVGIVRERLAAIAAGPASAGLAPAAAPIPRPSPVDDAAAQLGVEPAAGAPGSPARRLWRRLLIRATRPVWWNQRSIDGAILEALRQTDASHRQAREDDRAAWAAALAAAVTPLTTGMAALGADVQELGDELSRAAATPGAPRPETGGRVSGGFDQPGEGAVVGPGVIEVTGWAFTTPAPLSRLEIAVGGRIVGNARLGMPRPDVEASHPVPAAVGSGFTSMVDLAGCAAGGVAVTAIAVTVTGHRLHLPPRQLVVATDRADARAASVDGHPRRLLLVRPRSPGRGRHLLAVTHDLGRGGAQSFLLDLLPRLLAKGIASTVLAPREGPLRADLEAAGVDVRVQPMPLDRLSTYEEHQSELASWISANSISAVLANTVHAFAAVDAASRLGLPSLWAIHESLTEAELAAGWAAGGVHPHVQRRGLDAFAQASMVMFVSDATRRPYRHLGDAARFVVVPNAVDLARIDTFLAGFDRAAARQSLGIAPHEDSVVCIGSVEPRKGQGVLVRAFDLMAARRPRARLVLVGDVGGDYAAAVERYAVAAGLQDRVRLVRHTPDVLAWHGVADVFVCPSDNESMPGVILEAAASGVPVVASNIFGVPDLIEDGRSGYLCEPSDVASLAAALGRALDASAGERAAITAAARARVEQRHDARSRADHVLRLLDALTAAAPTGTTSLD